MYHVCSTNFALTSFKKPIQSNYF